MLYLYIHKYIITVIRHQNKVNIIYSFYSNRINFLIDTYTY